jgi:hypothetical protein
MASEFRRIIFGNGELRRATSIVAVSLIQYRMSTPVPLQRGARKPLTMSGDNIALELRTGSTVGDVPSSQTADLEEPIMKMRAALTGASFERRQPALPECRRWGRGK